MTTRDRIQSKLKGSTRYVFIRDDFKDIGSYSQVGKALRSLVSGGLLLKVGYGVYTKARQNSITGDIMPAAPGGSSVVIIETLERLNVPYRLVGATAAYSSGKSTQIPAFLEIETPPSFKRMLSVGNSKLNR